MPTTKELQSYTLGIRLNQAIVLTRNGPRFADNEVVHYVITRLLAFADEVASDRASPVRLRSAAQQILQHRTRLNDLLVNFTKRRSG